MADEALRQDLFIEFDKRDLKESLDSQYQKFFSRPFLKTMTGQVIVLNPSILASFLVHKLILLADRYGDKEEFIESYNNRIWEECRKDLQYLGHKKIQEKAYDVTLINNRCQKEEILTVGNNKLLFVQFICDAGDEYDDSSMFKDSKSYSNVISTRDRATYFIDKLPGANLKNIYQIVVLNSFGRRIRCKIEIEERSYSITLSPFALHCVSINERGHDEFFPKYIDAKKKLKTMPQVFLESELNIIARYATYDHSFYFSDDIDLHNTYISFGFEEALGYIIHAIKKENRQLIKSYIDDNFKIVALEDPKREIYRTIRNNKDNLPELVVKFEKVNIWIVIGGFIELDEIDAYSSILDAISYWLAEAKELINKMDFVVDTICLSIVLDKPIERNNQVHKLKTNSFVRYELTDKTIQMIWDLQAYQSFDSKSNKAEKEMAKTLIGELEKLSTKQADYEVLDKIFHNPLKKKLFVINVARNPCLMPIIGAVKTIPAEEENRLLDEIGAHFLASANYQYGKVADDKRAQLANEVVSYLYSCLKKEVASICSAGVYEQVCLDLELVIYYSTQLNTKFAYDIACYPEKTRDMMKQYNSISKASMALRFFAEYIAAIHPSGNEPLGTMEYDRILAICSLIIDWAYKNDLFYYNIFNTPVEFLRSGRIGMSRKETDYLYQINMTSITRKLEVISDPRISKYSAGHLLKQYQSKLDDAFVDEYGFTFLQFVECIRGIFNYGNKINEEVKRVSRYLVCEELCKETKAPSEVIEKIIDHITLSQREDFLVPPKPYTNYDVYPWRFNRELSFTRRPIIQYGTDLIWGNRQLMNMLNFTIDLIINGKYKANGRKLKELIGKLSNIRGNEFNSAVAQKLGSIDGLIVKERVSKINGKKIADEHNDALGDIDVLYIIPEKMEIIVGEVKDFSFAKNPYEMNQEYQRIFVDQDKSSYMTKHKRRVEWIKEHIEDVRIQFGLSTGKWKVKRVMFVSEKIISNEFYHQGENIVVYSDITEEKIKSI